MRQKKKKYRKSLQVIMFIGLALMGIVPVGIISGILSASSFHKQISQRTNELQYHGTTLVDEVEEKEYLFNLAQPVVTAEIEQLARLYHGRIILVDQNYRIVKDTYYLSEGKYNISEQVILCFGGTSSSRYDSEEGYLEVTLPVQGKDGSVCGVMVITASTEQEEALHDEMTEIRLVAWISGSVIVIALSILLSAFYVYPLKKVAKVIDASSQDSVGENMEIRDYQETEKIAQAYNRTLGRLRQLDESRQQFVSNVSHELKTPITSIRVLADSLTSMEDAPIEMYQDFMKDISGEIDRESQIIDDLLTLVRMDRSNPELNIALVNINEMIENILFRLRPLALQKNVDLTLESFRPVTADADEVKLNLAIMNLVENAIKYNVDNGWVRVSLNADHQYFYIKVADSGIGIPEKEWDHIFERFYRVDKARSRASGGTGLGLAITKSIISLHHGEIRVHSMEGEGTTFTVRIPRTYVRQEGEV
jgi:signal transduction histidine kinase